MSESLGSLAQSARSKQLKSARITLIVIGVLTIVANIAIAAVLIAGGGLVAAKDMLRRR